MFRIESYVTPILLSYVDKYVKDFRPADAQVSLWGGGVVLSNLVIKTDVLQQEVPLPFTLISGRIHELLIQVPWTKIMSEPIVVTIDTIECILNLRPPDSTTEEAVPEPDGKQVVQAPPGYMQALVRRIVSNIVLRVHHLIVKYVEDDIVLSLNVKQVQVNCADENWQSAFADIDPYVPVIRRLVSLEDLTLCLDRADADGKIRFYQEPLLYRCRLSLRVLTRLISANNRRAASLSVQLRSSKLAWGVTGDQLTLLLRILEERSDIGDNVPKSPSLSNVVAITQPLSNSISTSSNFEPPPSSWSEWAWSWVPAWGQTECEAEEPPPPPGPVPITFMACFDCVSFVFKVMELESGKKKSRSIIELITEHAAVKGSLCSPITVQLAVGLRTLGLRSFGKCVCGHSDSSSLSEEGTVYLKRTESVVTKDWSWPEDELIQTAHSDQMLNQTSKDTFNSNSPEDDSLMIGESLWSKMTPVVLVDVSHQRTPSYDFMSCNVYDNVPKNFEYSDWAESFTVKVQIAPLELQFCMSLIHRLLAIKSAIDDFPTHKAPEIHKRTLTVEEIEALSDNLPQRHFDIECQNFTVRVWPWDHGLQERSSPTNMVLDINLPLSNLLITGPMYPHRVCSAACQLPSDEGPIWQGARLHVTLTLSSVAAMLTPLGENVPAPRPVARADVSMLCHYLLHKNYFAYRRSVVLSYTLRTKEISICGSSARLQSAVQIVNSLLTKRVSLLLKHTTLSQDAINDEEAVALDLTVEDINVRGFITDQINTHTLQVNSTRLMALHKTSDGDTKQAWLFSGPDVPLQSLLYLKISVQWCNSVTEDSLDYIWVMSSTTAVSVDPLLHGWLCYRPKLKAAVPDTQPHLNKTMTSTQYFLRRRHTPPSSSGRGPASRSGSTTAADMVHTIRVRSNGSSSEPSERRDPKPAAIVVRKPRPWYDGNNLVLLHSRLRELLIQVDLGKIVVYLSDVTAPAVGKGTIPDTMEAHAAAYNDVLLCSIGRLELKSNDIFNIALHIDGPTYLNTKKKNESIDLFPWKLHLADVSCSTLVTEMPSVSERKRQRKHSLKLLCNIVAKSILEPVSTKITITVVTKTMEIRQSSSHEEKQNKEVKKIDLLTEEKLKYFTTGTNFKPSTLKEFVRGPAHHKMFENIEARKDSIFNQATPAPTAASDKIIQGPVVSIGVNVHADTPPAVVSIEPNQLLAVAAAIHCCKHILHVLNRPKRVRRTSLSTLRSNARKSSLSEIDGLGSLSEDNISESHSELVSLYESPSVIEDAIFISKLRAKSFFWFQWVVSRASLRIIIKNTKLSLDLDDIISSVDVQLHYQQMKLKFASAGIKHYERSNENEEWNAGDFGGRVLEAREPTNAIDDNSFLSVTVTQAQISNLPDSWKQELHPKMVQSKANSDRMWEIYLTLAPLEAVLQPKVINSITLVLRNLYQTPCLEHVLDVVPSRPANTPFQWPFLYVMAGGLRLLLHPDSVVEEKTSSSQINREDDTLVLLIDKIEVSPYPENPICRKPIGGGFEGTWSTAGPSYEGRQYEVFCENMSIYFSQFSELMRQAVNETIEMNSAGSGNPALKWTQPQPAPVTTSVMKPIQISCVLAPPLFMGDSFICGPAVDLNLVTDCVIELNINQLNFCINIAKEIAAATSDFGEILDDETIRVCSFHQLTGDQPTNVDDITDITKNMEGADSGVDTVTSSTLFQRFDESKKTTSSIMFADDSEPSDFLEFFLTLGVMELILYTNDDSSPEVIPLRPPVGTTETTTVSPVESGFALLKDKAGAMAMLKKKENLNPNLPATEDHNLILASLMKQKQLSNISLLHVSLHQPNLYYYKKKSQRSLQVSLFDAWVVLGLKKDDNWFETLASTTRGALDPVTDIPPALATVKLVTFVPGSQIGNSSITSHSRGNLSVDIERPVHLAVSEDRLRRLKSIFSLFKERLIVPATELDAKITQTSDKRPALYNLRQLIIEQSIEAIVMQTTQIGLSGEDGAVGWEALHVQVTAGGHPDRLTCRALVTALLASVGPPTERRHPLLHPMMLGTELVASWEPWHRTEKDAMPYQPTLRLLVDLDRITLELRPDDFPRVKRLQNILMEILGKTEPVPPVPKNSATSIYKNILRKKLTLHPAKIKECFPGLHFDSHTDDGTHFYKDDLRSGVFKILTGEQLPMAYQVMLHEGAVSWRYPHPRAITTIVASPLPDQDEEVHCVLEHYSSMLDQWEPLVYFDLPVAEQREINLNVAPPAAQFAVMWRCRSCPRHEQTKPFEFNDARFGHKIETTNSEQPADMYKPKDQSVVSAEQLCGVLRVDSLFSSRVLPRRLACLRFTSFEVHAHNSLPQHSSQSTFLEGYYVSKPLMKSHRVLTLTLRDTTSHFQLSSVTGMLMLLSTKFSSEMLDSATGAFEPLSNEAQANIAVTLTGSDKKEMHDNALFRYRTSIFRAMMNVPKVRTLNALAKDWSTAVGDCDKDVGKEKVRQPRRLSAQKVDKETKRCVSDTMESVLDGRISLWLHNTCTNALRVGQADTDQVVPLGPGTRLAYRWRNPNAPKLLKFALVGPTQEKWSNGVPFQTDNSRVVVLEEEATGTTADLSLHVAVLEMGARRRMRLSGSLCLANMLHQTLLFKVKGSSKPSKVLKTICFGELEPESLGRSVLCSANNDLILKIKLQNTSTSWSGDIPLKECPKEKLPWLVKVPSDREGMDFISVWCRIVRGRSDGRIIATFWPLYVLHSHIAHDTDVLIKTEGLLAEKSAPLITFAAGRGCSTHLLTPGTTTAKHSLTFQYTNLESPVNLEAVPMHYGVTDNSVFDKNPSAHTIDDVITDIELWLERSNTSPTWPYSIVTSHWSGQWKPASMQPRCDVNINYAPICAGGGCSLELILSPLMLLCNATPIEMTLRAFDAAPLCKIEPGAVISPPSAMLEKPFFISVLLENETFVSCELAVWNSDPGVYGSPPQGFVARDHPAGVAVNCHLKVAMLTLYYEVKHKISILGVSSTFLLINRLPCDVMVSPIAVPISQEMVTLQYKSFEVISPHTDEEKLEGTPLTYFWLHGRWQGGHVNELTSYIGIALSQGSSPAHPPVPVRLTDAPFRKAISLHHSHGKSMAVVVTQQKHEGRWIVTLSQDPCPQFMVHNHTRMDLVVGEPVVLDELTTNIEVIPDCKGVTWSCLVHPGMTSHYSTPAHCARYPLDTASPARTITFITIGSIVTPTSAVTTGTTEQEVVWSTPVAVTAGEQLVQLFYGDTIKLRVQPHPHTTLLELQDINENDISASDIRRRLLGPFSSNECIQLTNVAEIDRNTMDELAMDPLSLDTKYILTKPDEKLKHLNSERENLDGFDDKISTLQVIKPIEFEESHSDASLREGESSNKNNAKHPSETADKYEADLDETTEWASVERVRGLFDGIVFELGNQSGEQALIAAHVDRGAFTLFTDHKGATIKLAIAEIQVDNVQYDTGLYDFGVIASTRSSPTEDECWPSLWAMFIDSQAFHMRDDTAHAMIELRNDSWTVGDDRFSELTEVELKIGPLALFVEDAYISALVHLLKCATPAGPSNEYAQVLAEARTLVRPLRLRSLHIHPVNLTLTLHTAVRMYIALDQSPLRLSTFKIHDMMTSVEQLTHGLTVHYLSAAILGAGWVVGGLELLGAPGALAARVGGATGGVRGVASAAAAALLRSLSAWAGSLARNLDMLAGDEEHAKRAAAARRRPPTSLVAGLVAGFTNFAINILGAVGGLAHHPLVGPAVGETDSGAAALRRGLIGALAKPLSATADLVAYAGQGLLTQTGWDPTLQPRASYSNISQSACWRRDCVRWTFRLAELYALAGYEALLNDAQVLLLLTHKFLVIVDPETERINEMIDFRFCTLGQYDGPAVTLFVVQSRPNRTEPRMNEDDVYELNAAAMARVARYTGAMTAPGASRRLSLTPRDGSSYALHAALAALLHQNTDTHLPLM